MRCRTRFLACAVAGSLLVVGCSSGNDDGAVRRDHAGSSTTATTSATTPAGSHALDWFYAPPPRSSLCTEHEALPRLVSDLAVDAHMAAATILVKNRNPDPCALYGVPTLRFLDRSGAPLPTTVTTDPGRRARPVKFVFDQLAKSLLQWHASPAKGTSRASDCVTPAFVDVTLSVRSTPQRLAWTQGPVCRAGHVVARPMSLVVGQ
jgi:hypothetical protein